jgi:hypothetical protein
MPAWVPCPCCENFYCTIHRVHAHDCECPPVEEWTTDPYHGTQTMPKAYTARQPGLVAIRLDVTPAERDRLRVLAAGAGVPMSEYMRQLVRRELRRRARAST